MRAPVPTTTAVETSDDSLPAANTLRLAIFSDALPERNGAGTYYHDLIRHLRHQLGAVEMLQPAHKRRLPGLAIPMPGDRTQKLIIPNVPRLWSAFARLRPHVVVSITPGPFGLLGLAMAQYYRTGFLTAFHSQFDQMSRLYWNPAARRIAVGILATANGLLCRSSEVVMVHSNAVIDDVRRLGAREVVVVGTPLSPDFLTPPAPARDMLQRILFAGRLAPEKNVAAVVDAARKLPNMEFVIAGDGPQRRALRRRARGLDNVRFTGWLDRLALRDELDRSDLLLLPSRFETFGSIALEAMARGRPALVSAAAGIHCWHTLADGLISSAPDECLADAISNIARQCPEERKARAARARAAAETLNAETVDQWVSIVQRHARLPSDRRQ